MKILVLNAGSSSYKCAIFQKENENSFEKRALWRGLIDFGRKKGIVFVQSQKKKDNLIEKRMPFKNLDEILKELVASSGFLKEIKIIGHRVVHGGETFQEPILIGDEVKEKIRDLFKLAPLHNPANLEGIEMMEKIFPNLPQVAVFDTSFHSQISEPFSTYPIPYIYKKQGIKRFGFHGINHEYCMKRAFEILPQSDLSTKIISCHLGNGSSLAAIREGRSVDTTMGFTPMEGLMMGTRSGSIDPGILFYLMNEEAFNSDRLNELLNEESGLKGISGFSDMREILKRRDLNENLSTLSFEMFIHSLRGHIAKMAASLNGLDLLIFTAGIGENSPIVRSKCCEGLEFLGVKMDPRKNESATSDIDISEKGSKVSILVIKAAEEWAIAEKCLAFLNPT